MTAPVVLECEQCGAEFTQATTRQRFCKATCRATANKRPGKVGKHRAAQLVDQATAPAEADAPQPVNLFERATLAELVRLKKQDTMLGQQALVIARRMGMADETGAAIATLSREHSRLMAAAAAGARTADPVDKARESREQKQAQARQARRRRPGR